MLLSMTGFSSIRETLTLAEGGEIALHVEIKTLNTRFFETSCRLPGSLNSLEVPIISLLKKRLLRGRVYFNVHVSGDGSWQDSVLPSMKVISNYINAASSIQKEFGVKGALSISDVVNLDHVFSFERGKISKKDEKEIIRVVEKCIDDLLETRKSEGSCLAEDLNGRLKACREHISTIQEFFQTFMKDHKEKISKALARQKQEEDPELKAELTDLYLMLNKIDIHEEIVRFNGHLETVGKLLKNKQVDKGRRIDFLVQELGREINTITAKCSSLDIGSIAVDVKVELEKIREQVQNVV
jgi:uncharacterized protein (TIGR00255 family)